MVLALQDIVPSMEPLLCHRVVPHPTPPQFHHQAQYLPPENLRLGLKSLVLQAHVVTHKLLIPQSRTHPMRQPSTLPTAAIPPTPKPSATSNPRFARRGRTASRPLIHQLSSLARSHNTRGSIPLILDVVLHPASMATRASGEPCTPPNVYATFLRTTRLRLNTAVCFERLWMGLWVLRGM
jgi:hypothetical protein